MIYEDEFKVCVHSREELSALLVFKHFFYSMPRILLLLFHLREKIAGFIGLKKAGSQSQHMTYITDFTAEVGSSLGLFEVKEHNHKKIVTAQNDRHLDFVFTISLEKNTTWSLCATTKVTIHNMVGHIYFYAVKPIHKYFMPIILKRLRHRLESIPIELPE